MLKLIFLVLKIPKTIILLQQLQNMINEVPKKRGSAHIFNQFYHIMFTFNIAFFFKILKPKGLGM